MKTAIAFLLVVALIAITIDAATPEEEHVNSRMKKAPIEATPKEEHVNSRMKKAPIEDPIGARVTRQFDCCQYCPGCPGSFSFSRDDGCPVGKVEALC